MEYLNQLIIRLVFSLHLHTLHVFFTTSLDPFLLGGLFFVKYAYSYIFLIN